METTIAGKNNPDQFITGLTILVSHGLENLFGSGVNTRVFGAVTRAHFRVQIGGAGRDFLSKP
jgi:hypothetical protein